ncbi:hypothetical protein AJ80_00187 [Polytolypa hystricis UAMH7299]|uniref:Protein kinase domain-containing protein n=1 Tax=Polytolypa hystricis (strain UAMH7299) TaxID=1447883 RepID=A0A2B7Z313_POLH7|nr:hypothetical protein AJ80_00187 [Polytolypa hystricis UAMH7299]
MTHPLSDSFCTRYGYSKPNLPYIKGQCLTVQSHEPPAPTNNDCSYDPITAREREHIHPLKRCILHPPLEGQDGSTIANLEIIETVRAGDSHCAQLVVMQVKQVSPQNALPMGRRLLAKIYDPLYFDHEQDDADPFLCVDRDYSHETASYMALRELYGKIVPYYFGSFTLRWHVDKASTRSVRLILIENIPGTSLQQLNPAHFSQLHRQSIMKAVIDAETSLYTHNVRHGDMHPRNILVLNAAEAPDARRVVIIDFGKSSTRRTPYLEEEEQYLPGVEISPLLRWNKAWGFWHAFDPWIDWDWQPWLEYQYAFTRSSITDYMRSVWLPSVVTEAPPPLPNIE